MESCTHFLTPLGNVSVLLLFAFASGLPSFRIAAVSASRSLLHRQDRDDERALYPMKASNEASHREVDAAEH
jgi:hypothetical protein